MTPCLTLNAPEDSTDSAVLVALKLAYDQYGQCAGRYWELIQAVQELRGKYDH